MTVAPFWPGLVVAVAALGWLVVAVVRGRRDRTAWRRLAAVALVAVMTLRPAIGTARANAQNSDLDVLLLVDRTLSMAAEDYDGAQTRLTGARADVELLVERYPGARFALMTFTHEAYLEVAYTADGAAIVSYAATMQPVEEYHGAGSRIDVAREEAEEVLARAAKQQPDRRRVLVYLGDGEQTSAEPVESFASLRQHLSGALVLGYGTEQGGRMKSRPGGSGYVKDPTTYKDALSTLDPANLQRIAEQLGGSYQHRTAPGGTLAIDVRSGPALLQPVGVTTARNDVTWLLALLLLGPVLWELWDAATMARTTRRFLKARSSR